MNEVIRVLERGGRLEFARPEYLFLLLAVPIVAGLLIFYSRKSDTAFLEALRVRVNSWKVYTALVVVWVVLFGSLGMLAAGPQIAEYGPPETTPRGDYIVLVDVSRSMDASPSPEGESQIGLARQVVQTIVDETGEARFQIWGFSGLTFSLSNMTSNYTHLSDTVQNSLHIGIIPFEGSSLFLALERVARAKLTRPELRNVSRIILVGDGQSDGNYDLFSLAQFLKKADLSVISVGIGSKDGWKIPLFDEQKRFTGEYATITGGDAFISRLNETNLSRVSRETGGQYFNYKQVSELVLYINSTLSADYEVVGSAKVLRTTDISWILLFPLWISLVALSFVRKFY